MIEGIESNRSHSRERVRIKKYDFFVSTAVMITILIKTQKYDIL